MHDVTHFPAECCSLNMFNACKISHFLIALLMERCFNIKIDMLVVTFPSFYSCNICFTQGGRALNKSADTVTDRNI